MKHATDPTAEFNNKVFIASEMPSRVFDNNRLDHDVFAIACASHGFLQQASKDIIDRAASKLSHIRAFEGSAP